MAKVYLEREHNTTLEEAKKKVYELVERFYEKNKSIIKEINWNEDKTEAVVKSSFLKKGFFKITDTKVIASLDLTFMASPFKGKIESYLNHKFEQAFGSE